MAVASASRAIRTLRRLVHGPAHDPRARGSMTAARGSQPRPAPLPAWTRPTISSGPRFRIDRPLLGCERRARAAARAHGPARGASPGLAKRRVRPSTSDRRRTGSRLSAIPSAGGAEAAADAPTANVAAMACAVGPLGHPRRDGAAAPRNHEGKQPCTIAVNSPVVRIAARFAAALAASGTGGRRPFDGGHTTVPPGSAPARPRASFRPAAIWSPWSPVAPPVRPSVATIGWQSSSRPDVGARNE